MKKIYTRRGQKGENRPPEPKNGIRGPKSVWSCDISIVREFYMELGKIYFWVKKAKISLQRPKIYIHRSGILHGAAIGPHSPKTEFGE
jgi:hypothetical protein